MSLTPSLRPLWYSRSFVFLCALCVSVVQLSVSSDLEDTSGRVAVGRGDLDADAAGGFGLELMAAPTLVVACDVRYRFGFVAGEELDGVVTHGFRLWSPDHSGGEPIGVTERQRAIETGVEREPHFAEPLRLEEVTALMADREAERRWIEDEAAEEAERPRLKGNGGC